MKFRNFFLSLFVTLILLSCSEKEEKVSLIKEDILEMQMIDAYNEGLKEFNEGDVFFAEQIISSIKSLLPEFEDIAGKLMSESSAISLSERINFLVQILTSIQETAFLGVKQTLAEGFTSNEDFREAIHRIAKIRNKVDLLQARIKELELPV